MHGSVLDDGNPCLFWIIRFKDRQDLGPGLDGHGVVHMAEQIEAHAIGIWRKEDQFFDIQ